MRRVYSELSFAELEKTPRRAFGPRRLRFHRLRLAHLQAKATQLSRRLAGAYRMHERLLEGYYSRYQPDAPKAWFSDPLAPWRTWWRSLGIVLLIFNGVAGSAAAWVSYRCDADPLCDLSQRRCPDAWELLNPAKAWRESFVLHRADDKSEREFGCRRDLLAAYSSEAVRAFSLVEILLGVRTAYSAVGAAARGASSSGASAGQHGARLDLDREIASLPLRAYGTTYGAAARVLLTLDLVLLISPRAGRSQREGWALFGEQIGASGAGAPPKNACPWGDALNGWGRSEWLESYCTDVDAWKKDVHHGIDGWLRGLDAWGKSVQRGLDDWGKEVRRAYRSNQLVRTLDGWRRLNELEPQPAPIQYLIDRTIETYWPSLDKKISILPTVGDLLLEGELMQAFIANFLSSFKVIGLVLSAIKAARVRRGAAALRRDRAARKILALLRRAASRNRVSRLAHKHAWSQVLSDNLMRRDDSMPWNLSLAGGRGTAGAGASNVSLASLEKVSLPSASYGASPGSTRYGASFDKFREPSSPPTTSPHASRTALQFLDLSPLTETSNPMRHAHADLRSSPADLCQMRHRQVRGGSSWW